MAHIKVALKCVTPSNEYKKKQKNKNMNIKEVSPIKCCWDFIQSLNEKKKLSNNTKLQSLVTLSVGSFWRLSILLPFVP